MTAVDGTVSPADHRAAQSVLDALVDVLNDREEDGSWLSQAAQLELLGLLTAQTAAVRWAGYLEGEQRARRFVGGLVHAALDGEGLCPRS